jgi:hypothetical protein
VRACNWNSDLGEAANEERGGYLFAEAPRYIEPEPFIAYLDETFEKEGAEKVLSAYQITRAHGQESILDTTECANRRRDLLRWAPLHQS